MALWTPSLISTALWLDASDASTLFDAVSGGSAVALDGEVARWQDKSGNGRHVTQSTSDWRPLRKGSIRNLLDVIRFDGTNDFLIANSASDWVFLHGTSNASIYTVQRVANTESPNAIYVLLATRSSGVNSGYIAFFDDRSSIPASQVVRTSAFYGGATNAVNSTADGFLPGNQWAQLGFVNNNTASLAADRAETRLNGGVAVKNNVDAPTINNNTPPSALRIGSGIGTGFMAGDFGEVIIRQGVDTDSDRQLIEGYLAWKWGLQVNLPANHPYRFAAPGARFRSSFSTRYTYKPPKAKVFEGVRVRDHDYASLREGLVGAWCPSLPNGGSGNTLPDQSGRGNHGTLTNMGPEDWVSSGDGRALDFDGVNDFIELGSRGGDLTENIPFSVSMWALARATGQNDGLISRDQGGPYAFAVRFNGGSAITLLTDNVTFTGPTITTNVWFHLTVILAPSLRRFYLNGTLTHETTAAYTVTSNSDVLRIGCDFNPAADRCWNGLIDDCRIFNRALTQSEITALASRRGIGLQPSPTRFIAREKKTGLRRKILTGQT